MSSRRPAPKDVSDEVASTLRIFTTEERVLAALLVFVLATLASPYLPVPPWTRFFISVFAIVPLAGFIGAATEALADRLGGRIGGLFNATFGNSPDLLVGIIGVQKGLIPLVKATLIIWIVNLVLDFTPGPWQVTGRRRRQMERSRRATSSTRLP